MTLEVHEPHAREVAQRFELAGGWTGLVAEPAVDVVELRLEVDRGAVVPVRAIGFEMLVHAVTVTSGLSAPRRIPRGDG